MRLAKEYSLPVFQAPRNVPRFITKEYRYYPCILWGGRKLVIYLAILSRDGRLDLLYCVTIIRGQDYETYLSLLQIPLDRGSYIFTGLTVIRSYTLRITLFF
jgi:hypothetical protein